MASRGHPASSKGGFTLVEIMVSCTILAIAAMMLVASVSSQSKMNALARERTLATNAIRGYVEAMRQAYPSKGKQDMSGFLNDPTTPADYLTQSADEISAVRDARGLVLKMTDETGYVWGPAAGVGYSAYPGYSTTWTKTLTSTALPWLWTDATMKTAGLNASTTVSALNTGSYTAKTPPYAWATNVSATTQPSLTDLKAMGYIDVVTGTQICGRDLNGDSQISNNDSVTGLVSVDPASQLFIPCQITLSWLSGSGNSASRQRITVYAAFGPTH